jgi:hypothetical protein
MEEVLQDGAVEAVHGEINALRPGREMTMMALLS